MAAPPRARGFVRCATPEAAVKALEVRYDAAAAALRAALLAYVETGAEPALEDRVEGRFAYPELRVGYFPTAPVPRVGRAFGKLAAPGVYASAVTRPRFFRPYLLEQLSLLTKSYAVELSVGPSGAEIPYPFALEGVEEDKIAGLDPAQLSRVFREPSLAGVGDELVDGEWLQDPDEPHPLALFDAARVDYSLARLRHYTGTPAEHVQEFILFTNYHRYVDAFLAWAVARVRDDSDYEALSAPGLVITKDTPEPERLIADAPWRRYQMPACHLIAPGRWGVTLVNIGVGPSNAKTITDHLAVLRPQCWLMIGHCAGLRHSQRLGDYVLAHAYLRRDRVLDDHVPLEIPIPPIAEIQVALQEAAASITGETGEGLKARLRTGTVVTDADRNWELRSAIEGRRFNLSRAIAIDMESATIATNGFRFRVPYGTLLCVSDKPLHGELKLPGAANRFYDQAISQHLAIGIETIERLKRDGAAALHSRKLRAYDEPPFR